MFKIVEVKVKAFSSFNNCEIIRYEEDGILKFAACVEPLDVEEGDMVEVYSDEYVNYRGFGAMALKVVQQ